MGNKNNSYHIKKVFDKKKHTLADLKTDNENIIEDLNNKLKGFRCKECLSLLYFKLNNINKNDNDDLILETKCKNNHIKLISINEIFNYYNSIIITNEYKFVDKFYKRREIFPFKITLGDKILEKIKNEKVGSNDYLKYFIDEEENYYFLLEDSFFKIIQYFYICNTCKVIYYDDAEEIEHSHPTYKYPYKGRVYDGKTTVYHLNSKNKNLFENKIKAQNDYYEYIQKIIKENNLGDKINNYINILSNEIKFINELSYIYNKTKTRLNYDNYTSIISKIKLTKFDIEKYRKYLNENIIEKINKLNKELNSKEIIEFNGSKLISLLDYIKIEKEIIEIGGDICVLDKNHFIESNGYTNILYKIEVSIKENKLEINKKKYLDGSLKNIIKLNDNRIIGKKFNIVFIYSFNEDYSSFKLENQFDIKNDFPIKILSKNHLIVKGYKQIEFYKEVKKNEFQKISILFLDDYFENENILLIDKSTIAIIKSNNLYFYNINKLNKIYENKENKYSNIYLLKNNIIGLISIDNEEIYLHLMNIKNKNILFNTKLGGSKQLNNQKIQNMFPLFDDDSFIIVHQYRLGKYGEYDHFYKTYEFIKVDDNQYLQGNLITVNRRPVNKFYEKDNKCFFELANRNFTFFYPKNLINEK